MANTQEFPAFKLSGFVAIPGIAIVAGCGLWLAKSISNLNELASISNAQILGIMLIILSSILLAGSIAIEPNRARVLIFLGSYVGTVREAGFWWVNPLASKKLVSLRVRNFNSDRLKVNDARGNPIEIGAVVVWRVVDSAKAIFDVDYYEEFVAIQSETAIRALAINYPYDTGEEKEASLRGNPDEINAALQQEVQARLEVAGVEVIESRISYLAYAPEIAQVMLRRQQAQAIIAARKQIIEGALSMVEMSIERLSKQENINWDESTKAAMINNLLVVLTSEQNIQPVINTGNLHS
ncbi:MAG: SPFH domain-containing protein [Prochloraceae cyanobacterium]|nr:SPFH domain-containing protein [Prochloraceae cyanobacterium]